MYLTRAFGHRTVSSSTGSTLSARSAGAALASTATLTNTPSEVRVCVRARVFFFGVCVCVCLFCVCVRVCACVCVCVWERERESGAALASTASLTNTHCEVPFFGRGERASEGEISSPTTLHTRILYWRVLVCGRVLILFCSVQVDPDAVAQTGQILCACSQPRFELTRPSIAQSRPYPALTRPSIV